MGIVWEVLGCMLVIAIGIGSFVVPFVGIFMFLLDGFVEPSIWFTRTLDKLGWWTALVPFIVVPLLAWFVVSLGLFNDNNASHCRYGTVYRETHNTHLVSDGKGGMTTTTDSDWWC